MHDGAPSHYIRPVREFLSDMFGNKWIGRTPVSLLALTRAPDLTLMDFFFRGAVKHIVYQSGRPITSMQLLKLRTECAFRGVQSILSMHEKVRKKLKERVRVCLRNNGGHIAAGDQARLLTSINVDRFILWQRRRYSRHRRQR